MFHSMSSLWLIIYHTPNIWQNTLKYNNCCFAVIIFSYMDMDKVSVVLHVQLIFTCVVYTNFILFNFFTSPAHISCSLTPFFNGLNIFYYILTQILYSPGKVCFKLTTAISILYKKLHRQSTKTQTSRNTSIP